MPISENMFWKRVLHKYVQIYTHIYTCEKLFTKTQSLNSVLALQANFLEWRLTRFGKKALHRWTCCPRCHSCFDLNIIRVFTVVSGPGSEMPSLDFRRCHHWTTYATWCNQSPHICQSMWQFTWWHYHIHISISDGIAEWVERPFPIWQLVGSLRQWLLLCVRVTIALH